MTILDTLAESAKRRVADAERRVPQIRERALRLDKGNFPFEQALRKPGLSFICEVKRASPSKGVIAERFPYLDIAREYAAAGADAISVLTEPEYFLGNDVYLSEISAAVSTPTLRKDFTVSEYQIYEAKTLGASAVLLIASILDDEQLTAYVRLADSLGLSALTETRNESEIARALSAGSRIIGVNNRNLEDFSVDLRTAERLRALVPADVLFVAESGISGASDIHALCGSRPDAVLIGEALMTASDKPQLLRQLREAAVW
jgi:indole-3-glycerol phosphate synthase